ncbi:hypothetical protein PUNSTDRAFT_122080 [Punctularia strigosozonata HHB-11173 SS5]|uniref:uncharacterized protein n=1 Tax=Punctularia strigosozonata (strain HHB-11173) TaxID=741275 RepID=UPI0004416303|nr:uncharacterized protein PUNSTDRAFT_122080 [Punctularia strigosozonata HHB-11173 SS5]EIN06235.1 hypothetical protein PUNSTDRAFT_122080 [Punctularia strigosozonata HHB-11173 SS5]
MANAPQPGTAQGTPTDSSQDPSQMSWEGDRMFNIYIYDYCNKRGFRRTAEELVKEAELTPEAQPPINARQGLLFEWWSVFWVLFTAKSNGNGSEDALVYTQHQAQQQVARASGQRTVPPNAGAAAALPMPLGRNGYPRPPPQGAPNGIHPAGGPPPPNGAAPFPPTGGQPPQPNGIVPAPGQPGAMAQQQNYPQRQVNPQRAGQPPPPSQQQQQQGQQQQPNGSTYPSPTMAHSPQGGAGGAQQGPGPSPLANRGMLPPPGQQTFGRPPSRAQTPGGSQHPGAGGMMTQPSPSMAPRQPPGGMQSMVMSPHEIHATLATIPPMAIPQLRAEAGIQGDKELQQFTPEEKGRVAALWRSKSGGVLRNPPGGPSGPQGMPGMPPRPGPAGQPPMAQQRPKRSSRSPPDEQMQPTQDSSPPDAKRIRPSPNVPDGTPMVSFVGQPPQGGMRPVMGGGAVYQGQPGMVPLGQQMAPPPPHTVNGIPTISPMIQNQIHNAREQYRMSMQTLHKSNLPSNATLVQGLPGGPDGSGGFPGGRTPFPGGPPPQQHQQQPGQQQPMSNRPTPGPSQPPPGPPQPQPPQGSKMGPPPSPANAPKEPGASPRTAHTPNSHAPTPAPAPAPAPTPAPAPAPAPAPEPSLQLGGGPDLSADLFSDGFMSIADFDPGFFGADRPDLDINQWFNPDGNLGNLDFK